MNERTLETGVFFHLIGSFCYVEGRIASIRDSCPFTFSKKPGRQWMVMLQDVCVGGVRVDHMWLEGMKRIKHFRKLPLGTVVSLTGIVRQYDDHGVRKWTLKQPFRNVHEWGKQKTSESFF